MNAYKTILDDINRTIRFYTSEKIIVNAFFSERSCCTDNCIQSKRESHGIEKDIPYPKLFTTLHNNDEYLCLLKDSEDIEQNIEMDQDGSAEEVRKEEEKPILPIVGMFQIKYQFQKESGRNNYVKNACLIFLPKPDENWEEGIYRKNYIRIEYSNSTDDYSPVTHPKGHIHIGYDNDFRIGINRVPLFSEFFQLILFLNHQDIWISLFPDGTELLTKIREQNREKVREKYTDIDCLTPDELCYISLTI